MIPRGSTARRSIANSILPWWLSSRQRYRHTEGRDVTITYPAFNRQIQLAIVTSVGPSRPIPHLDLTSAFGAKRKWAGGRVRCLGRK